MLTLYTVSYHPWKACFLMYVKLCDWLILSGLGTSIACNHLAQVLCWVSFLCNPPVLSGFEYDTECNPHWLGWFLAQSSLAASPARKLCDIIICMTNLFLNLINHTRLKTDETTLCIYFKTNSFYIQNQKLQLDVVHSLHFPYLFYPYLEVEGIWFMLDFILKV